MGDRDFFRKKMLGFWKKKWRKNDNKYFERRDSVCFGVIWSALRNIEKDIERMYSFAPFQTDECSESEFRVRRPRRARRRGPRAVW
jgi:hypothetical protein